MCGRFVQVADLFAGHSPWPELAEDLAAVPDRYNLAPTQRAAIIMDADGKKAVKRLRWGLIPPWAKELGKYSTTNARLETVAEKASYKAAFRAPRRCLIPMAGYYEWTGKPGNKTPYFIARKDGETLYAAGLWEPRHRLQDEGEDGSCTMITHDSVEVAAEVHTRMPVFLPHDLADAWLTADADDAMAILLAADMPELTLTRVSKKINNARNPGGPDSIEPADD